MNDGGVVPAEFPADFREGEIGQLTDQIHGNLPGLGGSLVFEGSPQDRFVNGVKPADLTDDERRRGNGVSLHLEHVVDGPGDVGKIQRHVVQVPVGQNFFHSAFNLPDIVGDVVGDVVADVVPQIQPQGNGFVFQNGHTGFIVRRLNVCQKTPFKTGFQSILQGQHIAGLPVRGHDDLLVFFV